jgi:CheY-like chemotaxis protein
LPVVEIGEAWRQVPKAPSLILIVEDDEDIRAMMKELFEGEGYRVVTAVDGRDALDVIERIGKPSVILLDLMMPRMSGGDFLETARRRRPDLARVPVVVITGYAQMMFSVSPVERMLTKPVDLNALLDIVRQYCRPTVVPMRN